MIAEKTVIDALPKENCWLSNYVGYCSQRTAAHLAYHVGVGLSLLSQACPPTLTLPFSSPLASHLYVMLVGSSSKAFKTSAVNQGLRILRDVAGDMLLEQPGSREALIDTVRARPHGMIVYPEFGDFLASAYGDRSYARAMKTAFTSIYDGTPLGRSLVKKPGEKKDAPAAPTLDPRLSILAGVATPFLEDYTEGPDWSGGFLGRFYTIYADPERKFSGEPLDDPGGRLAVLDWYRELHYLHGSRSIRPGPCLWLNSLGLSRWEAFNLEMEKRRQKAHPTVDAACSRAVAMAAKIALALSWDVGHARSGQPWYVPTELAESAIALATLHLESVTELAERIVTGRDMQDRRKVLDAIPPNMVVRLGDVLRRAQMLKRRGLEVLDTLCEEKVVTRIGTKLSGEWYLRTTTPELMQVATEHLGRSLAQHSAGTAKVIPLPTNGSELPLGYDPDFGPPPIETREPGDDSDLEGMSFPGGEAAHEPAPASDTESPIASGESSGGPD